MRFKSRIERLETQQRDVQERRFRIVVTRTGTLDMEKSTCTRTRLPNGLLSEIIHLEGMDEHLTDEEFERWVESFPIEDGTR